MKLQEGRLRRRRGKGSLLYRTPFPEADKLGKYSMHLYPTAATKSLQRLLSPPRLHRRYSLRKGAAVVESLAPLY